MKGFAACMALLAAILISPQASHAELHWSGNYHFNAFEHNPELCKQVLRGMKEGYPYDGMNLSTDGDTVRYDDYKYHERRCFHAAGREFCSGGRSWSDEVIEITCYPDGDVRIRYERPRDDESCMTKDGHTYCNSDDYEDKPHNIKGDIDDAIEKQQHAGTYRIYINVTPSDARVKITNIKPRFENGMYLSPGHYDIEVSKPGFSTRHFSIDHQADEESYSVELTRAVAMDVWLSPVPGDSKIELLDSSKVYKPGMELMPGSYRFQVSHEGFDTKTFTVKVSEEEGVSPSVLVLEMNEAGHKKLCGEVRQAILSGVYQGTKLTAEQIRTGKENFNKDCVPRGFSSL